MIEQRATVATAARPAIVVTPRSLSDGGHPALDALRDAGFDLRFPAPGRSPSRAELLAALPGSVGYLAGTETIDAELIAAAPELRMISRNGIGVDAIDLDAADRAGVIVAPAPGANSQGVAELAITLALSAARRIPWHDARLSAGGWERSVGFEVNGKTLGIIGCGQVGRRVATMAIGLGMSVLAFDAYPSPDFDPEGFRWAERDEVFTAADIVTLHAPPSPAGPLVDAERLAEMRSGAVLINTARASLVDLDAVLAALERGELGHYATDVFETEPPAPHPLWSHESVTMTPHLGGYTGESIDRAAYAAVDNLLRELSPRA